MAAIDTNEVTGVLQKRIYDAGLGLTIAYPNFAASTDRPRLEIQHLPGDRTGGTLKGGTVAREPRSVIITVVTDKGSGTQASEDYADQIAALFPEGLKLTITGGELVVRMPPNVGPGYYDEAEYRNPVTVRIESVTYN